jgi:hypothetical protein
MGPNHHKIKIKMTVTLALVLAAIAPDAASARLDLNPTQSRTTPSQPTVQIVRVSAPEAFDWGDAGIGAAGTLGLSTLAIGSALVIAARRDRMLDTPDPGNHATPHQRTAGDPSRGSRSKPASLSDQQEAVK